jgi:hypothetical protein
LKQEGKVTIQLNLRLPLMLMGVCIDE